MMPNLLRIAVSRICFRSRLGFRLAIAVSVPVPVAVAAPSPIPTQAIVPEQVTVGGEQIVLGDVATIYAKDLVDFKALSSIVLSRIPDDKGSVSLPSSYLEARIRAALPAGASFALRAPAAITFQLQRLGITAQDFASEIERQARTTGKFPAGTDLEVEVISGIDQLKGLSLADTRIEPQAEMPQWKGDLSFKAVRGNSAPLWVRARLRWFSRAWVASRPLRFNEQPGPDAFTEARVETTAFREEPLAGTREELGAALASARLGRALAANAPLFPSAIERKPDAASGAALRVVFVGESGVRVSADGLLVGAGTIGGDVKARLKSSKKLVTGKLVSPGMVEVSL
jgi:flagella basal body P-ring formation protein FlgA